MIQEEIVRLSSTERAMLMDILWEAYHVAIKRVSSTVAVIPAPNARRVQFHSAPAPDQLGRQFDTAQCVDVFDRSV